MLAELEKRWHEYGAHSKGLLVWPESSLRSRGHAQLETIDGILREEFVSEHGVLDVNIIKMYTPPGTQTKLITLHDGENVTCSNHNLCSFMATGTTFDFLLSVNRKQSVFD